LQCIIVFSRLATDLIRLAGLAAIHTVAISYHNLPAASPLFTRRRRDIGRTVKKRGRRWRKPTRRPNAAPFARLVSDRARRWPRKAL